nr:response regulator [Gammaproteobacteria bacterium]
SDSDSDSKLSSPSTDKLTTHRRAASDSHLSPNGIGTRRLAPSPSMPFTAMPAEDVTAYFESITAQLAIQRTSNAFLIHQSNLALKNMLGYPPEDDLPSQNLTDFIHPEDIKKFKLTINMLENKHPPGALLIRWKNQAGEYIWLSWNFVARNNVIYGEGRITHDYVNYLHRSNALNQALVTHTRATNSHVLHDVRSEMNPGQIAVQLALQIIKVIDDTTDQQKLDELQEYLALIAASFDNALHILDNSLEIAKLQAGGYKAKIEITDLHKIISDITKVQQPKMQQKKLKLELQFPATLSFVKTSGFWVNAILVNLINNAFKFTDKGSITVKVETDDEDKASHLIKFSVTDTGAGMTEAELARIFKPFAQANERTYEQNGGTGLGLTICKLALEMLGSELEVTSKKDKGTTFSFSLACPTPTAEEVSHYQENLKKLAEEKSLNEFKLTEQEQKNTRILLAEDNNVAKRVALKVLSNLGFDLENNVIWAKNGKVAVDFFKKESFNIVLMDWQMPEMNGLQATQAIRKHEKEMALARTPIIGLSANARKEDPETATKAGMDGYLTKPIKLDTLEQTIATQLRAAESGKTLVGTGNRFFKEGTGNGRTCQRTCATTEDTCLLQ